MKIDKKKEKITVYLEFYLDAQFYIKLNHGEFIIIKDKQRLAVKPYLKRLIWTVLESVEERGTQDAPFTAQVRSELRDRRQTG